MLVQIVKNACENAGNIVADHFPGVGKMVGIDSMFIE